MAGLVASISRWKGYPRNATSSAKPGDSQHSQIEKDQPELALRGVERNNKPTDKRNGQHTGNHPAPSQRRAERKLSAPAGASNKAHRLDGFALVLASVPHARVSDDQKKKQNRTIGKLQPISGGQTESGMFGQRLRDDEIEHRDDEPCEGAEARDGRHGRAPAVIATTWYRWCRVIQWYRTARCCGIFRSAAS